MGIGESHGGCLVGSNGHRFYCGIALPIGIAAGNLFCVKRSRLQSWDGYGSILPCCEGRAGHRAGAGRIRIKPDLPAAQIFTCVRSLNQLHAAGIQLVCEADGGSSTAGNGHRLRVGAGTVVQSVNCAVCMPKLLNVVSSGCQPCDGDFAAGIGSMQSRNQGGASRIGIDSKLPAGEVLSILGCFRQADRPRFQLIYKADSRSSAAGDRHLLGIGAGACVESIDAAVRMPQLLDIVGTSQQTRHGDLSAAVRGMGPGDQAGTGAVAVNSKPPAGKVLAILCGLRQADSARIGCTQLEIGIEISAGGRIQLHTGLIGRTGAVVNGKGRVRRRWQIAACREHRGLGNRPSLGNGQAVSALAEAGAVSVGEGEIGQYSIGIGDRCSGSGHGDRGGIVGFRACKAGNLHGLLNAADKRIVVGREAGNIADARIVEDISAGIAIGAVADKGIRVSQAGHDFIDQKLGGNPQRHIGIVRHGGVGYRVGTVPLLAAVQQHQGNGLPIGFRHGIPDIGAPGTTAAIHGHIVVHVVSGGAGGIILTRLDAVDGIVRVGHTVDSGKVPPQVLDVSRFGAVSSVGFIGHRNLAAEIGGVIGGCLVEEKHIGGCGGCQHNGIVCLRQKLHVILARILIGSFRGFRWLCGICRLRIVCRFREFGQFRPLSLLRCLGDCFLRQSALTVQLRGVNCRYDADEQHQNQKKRDIAFQVQYHEFILSAQK